MDLPNRFPLPMAYGDPAFLACLSDAIDTPELVEQFDRLYGATLTGRKSPIEAMVDRATGKQEDDIRAFVRFIHDCVYLRLTDDAIHSLRAAALAQGA